MENKLRVGILATHPIQYYVPWYREISRCPGIELKVFFCQRQDARGQADAGFGVEFDWDLDLLDGYYSRFLLNRSCRPDVNTFFGCDTPQIDKIIAESGFDAFIVHGWYTKAFWQAMRACWKYRVPLFVRGDSYLLTERFLLKRWAKYLFYRWFISKFNGYLVTGKRNKEYYLHYGADKERMFFVPHCVDNDFFSRGCLALALQRDSLRSSFGVPADALVFLFAGKFIRKKRPLDFLKAIELAREDNPGIYGLLAGDGPLRKELEDYARKRALPVYFTGFLNQTGMPQAYAAADVLVLPSGIGETWGLVANEAMACSLPVIASDQAGCCADLVIEGKTGNSYPCGDIARLAALMKEFSLLPQKTKAMGEQAKDLIKNYSLSQAVNGLLEALRKTR